MTATARGPLPWTGTAARTRELGYGQAMGDIAALTRQMLKDAAGKLSDGADGWERLAAALTVLDELIGYTGAVHLLSLEAALTINDWWALGDGFSKTYKEMPGGAS